MTFYSQSLSNVESDSPYLDKIMAELRADKFFLLVLLGTMIVWTLGNSLLYALVDGPGVSTSERAVDFFRYAAKRFIIFAVLFVVIRFFQHERSDLEGSVFTHVFSTLRTNPAKYAFVPFSMIIALIGWTWMLTVWMSIKTAIPAMTDYWADPLARQIDITLFGKDVWLYFQWVYDHPVLFRAIDVNYASWSALVAGFWMWALCSRRMERQRRYQYIFATVIVWFVAGNVLATLLASGGPIFHWMFTDDAMAFQPLIDNIYAINEIIPLHALNYQEYLVHYYYNPETRLGGISAVPSVHVASSLLMLCLFWRIKVARWTLIVYNLIIWASSVILGWHYAVDGIVAAPVTFAGWWVAGKLSAFIEARSPEGYQSGVELS